MCDPDRSMEFYGELFGVGPLFVNNMRGGELAGGLASRNQISALGAGLILTHEPDVSDWSWR